jgi:hypothetical protein|tara:strand:- start:254 stop:547 length:294 start_codon:yes stop_codon:yes gene_type:complete
VEAESKQPLGFKIRHKTSGLYLSSISKNKWTKVGKTWPRRGDLIRAINAGLKALGRMKKFNRNKAEEVLDDISSWDIIELTESRSYSALFHINKIKL